jgi:hypothetical protein
MRFSAEGSRCAPHARPLSEAKTIIVLESRPVARSASTIDPTSSSTESSVAYWRRRNCASSLIWRLVSGFRARR